MGIYPNLAIMRFSHICVFRQPCETSQAEAGWFPISFLLSGMLSGFSHAGYSLTSDQIFSHIFCNCMASQPHNSVGEAQILRSLGRFSHILDT